jgi:hypothetical protein
MVKYTENSNVIQPRQQISSKYPDNLFMRSLSIGFYHAMGDADQLEESYNRAGYRFIGKNLFGAEGGGKGAGTLQWRPRDIRGPTKAEASEYGIGGDNSAGRGGGATWSEYGLDGEGIKKDVLPTLAFHKRGSLGKIWGPEGRLGWGNATSPLDKAKSYVWKKLNGPNGWQGDDPPPEDTWGYSAAYLNLIRERSKYNDNRKAAELLSSFMQSVGAKNLGLSGLQKPQFDSEQEALIRLMPYLRQYMDDEGRVSLTELQQAVQRLMDTPGEQRLTTYDLESSMQGFKELEAAINKRQNNIQGGFTGLKDYAEITEIDQRVAGKLSKNLDLSSQRQRDALAAFMEKQLNDALRQAYDKGRALSFKEAPDFAGQATRRMEEVFNNAGTLEHTWLEPVFGGIGLYNVVAPYGGKATVHVSYLPTNIDLTRMTTGIASTNRLNILRGVIANATYNTGFTFAGIEYGATTLKTLMSALAGDTSSFEARQRQTGVLQTRGVVMTEGDLTDEVYRFVTGVGLSLQQSETKATTTQTSSQFDAWASSAVTNVAKYGQQQANRLVTQNYQSWVRDTLTMGTQKDEDGNESQYAYGDRGSRESFIERFEMNRLYQPKPFLWLRRSGVTKRAAFKAGERRKGPFQ